MPRCARPAAGPDRAAGPAAACWPPRWPARGTEQRRFVLAVTATAREAEDLSAALRSLLPPNRWATSRPGRRCRTSGCRPGPTPRASGWPCCAGWPTPTRPTCGPGRCGRWSPRCAASCSRWSAGWATWSRSAWRPGQEADLEEVVTRLVEIGYARTELVEKRGEMAVRGGILDVFPPTEEHPLRVDFFGDEVEEIRYFKVADQRSLEVAADALWAPPCRELLLTPGVRSRAKELAAEWPGLGEVLSKLADGITVEGMEAFAPDPLRPDGTAAGLHPGRGHRGRLRPGADPGPGGRPGRDQPGVPGGIVGQRGGRRPGAGGPGRSSLPGHHRHPVLSDGSRHPVVDDHPIRGHRIIRNS